MPRAVIFNSDKDIKRAIDTISTQSFFDIEDVTLQTVKADGISNLQLILNTDSLGEMEAGIASISKVYSWNLQNTSSLKDSYINRIRIQFKGSTTPINFIFFGCLALYYSNVNIDTGVINEDTEIETIYSSCVSCRGTLHDSTGNDNINSSIIPFTKILVRNTGYFNIQLTGIFSFINRTAPSS